MGQVGVDGQKTCTKCRQRLDRGNFGPSARSTDGLQVWCRECMVSAMSLYRAKKREKKIKDTVIISKVLPEVAGGKTVKEAYKEVTGIKSGESCNRWLSGMGEDVLQGALDKYRGRWLSEETLGKYQEYLERAMSEGTLTEQKGALELIARISGLLVNRQEVRSTGVSREDRDRKLNEVIERMKN